MAGIFNCLRIYPASLLYKITTAVNRGKAPIVEQAYIIAETIKNEPIFWGCLATDNKL